MSNDKLQDWKDMHCNTDCVDTNDSFICRSKIHSEVTFGLNGTCKGCPYKRQYKTGMS